MKRRQEHAINTLVRVQNFLDQHAPLLQGLDTCGARLDLDTLVAALQRHAADQMAFAHATSAQAFRRRVLAKTLLLHHMRPIAAVALAQLRDAPDFAALVAPAYNTKPRELLAAASAMARAAGPFAATFIHAGLSTDFIQRLTDACATLSASMAQQGSLASQRSGATAGLAATLAQARKLVKVLDALVVTQLDGQDALLAEWRAARRYYGQTSRAPMAIPFVPRPTVPRGTAQPESASATPG